MKDGFRYRLHIAWASIAIKGGLHLGSLWLRDSEGLSAANLLILQEVAVVLKQISGPWVIGGDWNLTPAVLRSTSWLNMVGGMIVAPNEATCNGSVYDFFVVSKGLAPAVAGVQRLEDAGLVPHWPASEAGG